MTSSPPPTSSPAREALVFVCRPAGARTEVLLGRRCNELGGYWHPIAGAVEAGETDEQAALRELREETALDGRGALAPRTCSFSYTRAPATPARRLGAGDVDVTCFRADVDPCWEPQLDWEHDESRWCEIDDAVRLLHWPLVSYALIELTHGESERMTA
jgi:8-oxo-dGTP pyrophosphatase MutT (NUDIX family)